MIYVIGSLRNPAIPGVAQMLRDATKQEVFASWFAAGERADDAWKEYEQGRGLTYTQALYDHAAQNVIAFDKRHLDRCAAGVLVYPAGKSGHTEMGYLLGQGKPVWVYMPEEPAKERWDVMLGLATRVCVGLDEFLATVRAHYRRVE